MLQEREAELAFLKMSSKAVEDKAAPIFQQPYYLGFELVYRSPNNNRLIGIFGFRLGKHLVYIPVFYIEGKLKGTDLLYLQSDKQFVLLSPEWCDYLISKYDIHQGRAISDSESSKATQEMDMRWLAYPPEMTKSASEDRVPLGYVFGFHDSITDDDVSVSFKTYFEKQASESDKKALKRFIDREGYKAFEKIACAVHDDYEFANNMVKLVDTEDWYREDFVKQASVEVPAEKEVSEEDKILDAKNCILVHKGKFNPFTKSAAEQIEKGITIEDRRDESSLNPVYALNEEQYRNFEVYVAGIYDVLGADGTTREFAVFSGLSDGGAQPCVMVEPDSHKIIFAKDIKLNHKAEEGYMHRNHAYDLAANYNQIMARPVDFKYYTDVTVKEPEVSDKKAYAIYSKYNNYLSDECFIIVGKSKEDDVTIYKAVPFYGYEWVDADNVDTLSKAFTIRVNPDAPRSNIEARVFRSDEIDWIPIAISKKDDDCCTKVEIDDEGESDEVKAPKVYVVEESDFTPGTLEDYDLGLATSFDIDKSKIDALDGDEYLMKIKGYMDFEPTTKIASIVKLMHDLNISQGAANELLNKARQEGHVEFYHKKIASKMVLRPEPNFYESLDPDLGINIFHNDTKVVPIEVTSMDQTPNPRYGDHATFIGDADNSVIEEKPKEIANKNSEESDSNILLTASPNMLARIAEKTGNKNIFDHGIIATYAKSYDASNYIAEFLPDLRDGLDKLGRLLFLELWKPGDFATLYGSDDLIEFEGMISSNFKQLGELVLDLSLKTKPESINNSTATVE